VAVQDVGLRFTLQQRRQAVQGVREVKDELDGVADAGRDVGDAGRTAARGLDRASDRRFARGLAAIRSESGLLAGSIGRGLLTAGRIGATGLGLITAGAIAAGGGAISLAGDARETASAFDTVFGPAAGRVQRNLDGLTSSFGLYNPELQDATRQFGVFGKAAGIANKDLPGFSTSLTRAGLDLSSFYNTDPGETFQALQSGLSGEAEPLRQFGIFISDATMKAKAATMGLTGTLTEQQKVMVRQALIMESLGDAQGDLARTSGGFANQQRKASGQAKTFLTMLGGPLTTAATGAFRGMNAIGSRAIAMLERRLPSLESKAAVVSTRFERWGKQLSRRLPNALQTAQGKWSTFMGYVDRAPAVLSTVSGYWDTLVGKIHSFRAGGGDAQIGELTTNVERLGPAVAAAGAQLPGLSDALSVANVVTGFLADHTDLLAKAMPVLAIGYAGLKASQLAANVVLAASLPMKIAEIASNRALTKSNQQLVASRAGVTAATATETVATAANTTAQSGGIVARARSIVTMTAQRVATLAVAAATKAHAAATWLLTAAMNANPIGLVIAGVALLAAGFVLLYRKSDTFRGMIDGLWNGVLKPFGKFIGGALVSYFLVLAKAWLTMARFGIQAFTWLLKAAFATFDGILAAADKGLGWVPGLGGKIGRARDAFRDFGNSTIGKLDAVGDKLRDAQNKVDDLARRREGSVDITVRVQRSPLQTSTYGELGGMVAQGQASQATPAPTPRLQANPRTLVSTGGDAGRSSAEPWDLPDYDPGAGGGAFGGRPTVVQVVLPNGKVLAEAVVNDVKGQVARK